MTLSTFTPDVSAALGGPEWLVGRRADSWEKLDVSSWPTESEEVWRYSGIDRFDPLQFAPQLPGGSGDDGLLGDTIAIGEAAASHVGERSALVVTRQGAAVSIESSSSAPSKGFRVIGLASGLSAGGAADGVALERNVERLGALAVPGDSFELLHFALLTDAVSVEVDAGVVLADPVVIVHVIDPVGGTGGKSPVLVPHTVVSLAEGSEASVVELFVTPAGDAVAAGDSGPSALVLPIAELQVADAAHLAYTGMQALPDSFWEIASQVSTIGRDASLRSFSAGLGGGYARLRSDSRLLGQNGHASLCAAYLGTGRQVLDFRTLQSHEAPRTESDLLFKGAVADTARSVYTGMIRILHGAVKSNAFQTNQNLVLSEGAHADSVPNLDIHENDVKCSHASTVGPIDEDQRYYLESRGVEPTEAERLIVFGFFSDLASRAPVAGITRWIERLVSAKLSTGSRLGSTIGEPNG